MNYPDHSCHNITPVFTRRDVLKKFWCGFGWLAFAGIASEQAARAAAGAATAAPVNPLCA